LHYELLPQCNTILKHSVLNGDDSVRRPRFRMGMMNKMSLAAAGDDYFVTLQGKGRDALGVAA